MPKPRIQPLKFLRVIALILLSVVSWSSQYYRSRVIFAEQMDSYRYISQPLGFEVDLPVNWKVNEYHNVGFGFSFSSPNQVFDDDGSLRKGAYITVWVSPPVTDPATLTPSEVQPSEKQITVGGKPAFEYVPVVQERDFQIVIDAYRDTLLYRFTLHYNTGDVEQKTYIEIFEKVLASLAFTVQEGNLPLKEAGLPVSTLNHIALAYPFEAGYDWQITSGGGYNNGDMHGGREGTGYALYALDFQKSEYNTGGELALAPTSGILSWKETTSPKCIDISIDHVSDTSDLYLQVCHVDFESYLGNGSHLTKGQVLGTVATDGCGGYCTTPHIHIAAFKGKRGNPWTDPSSMTAIPFVMEYNLAEYNLALDGIPFPPDGTHNQYGDTCCYRSSLWPICPIPLVSDRLRDEALSDVCPSPFTYNLGVIDTIPVERAAAITLSPDGNKLYVVQEALRSTNFKGGVIVIDTRTKRVVDTIPLGNGCPLHIAVTPNGRQAYVAISQNSGTVISPGANRVGIIDTSTNMIIGTILIGGDPYGPSVSAVTPDGNRVYVTHRGSNVVHAIDAASNTVINTIPVGSQPFGIAITPDGSRAYVANRQDSTVSVIDTRTNTVIETIPLSIGSSIDSTFVAIVPDGSRAYVTFSSDPHILVSGKSD